MKLEKSITAQDRQNIARPNVDISDGDIIKILNEGEWTVFNYKGQERKKLVFLIKTRFQTEKLLPLNQQSINNLIDAYGDETENWVGKEARVWIFKSNVGGSFKDIVYLSHPDWIFKENRFVKPDEKE
jgi:hypothetical protein